MGVVYRKVGDAGLALEHFEQSLVIFRESGDRRGAALALWNMGITFGRQGDLERAARNVEAALQLFRRMEDPNAARAARMLKQWKGRG